MFWIAGQEESRGCGQEAKGRRERQRQTARARCPSQRLGAMTTVILASLVIAAVLVGVSVALRIEG